MKTQDVSYRLLSARPFATVAQTPTRPELALENVNTGAIETGAMCIVGVCPAGPGGLFALNKLSVAVVDGFFVLPTENGVGRWLRLDSVAFPVGAVHANSILNHFGEVQVPGGTLEANAVPLWTIGHGVVTTLGYSAQYRFDVTLVAQVALAAEGVPGAGTGVKLQWDINGDGVYEIDGARYTAFGVDADFTYRTIVLRESRVVTYAALGALQTPVVRAVGWDTVQGAGWVTQEQVAPIVDPNSMEWRFSWA